MDKQLIENVKEAATFVAVSSGIGFAAKKVLKQNVTSDPSSSLMNAAKWVVVMLGAIYTRDYLIKQKILPS